MSPRPRLTESRRKEILVAATAAIADRGLCETRIADVAARIGASPALILYYFPSKTALLAEALVYQDQLAQEQVRDAIATAPDALSKLAIIVDESCPRVAAPGEEPDSWMLWPAAWEMARHDPALAAARARLDEAWREMIAEVVSEGVAQGELGPVDPSDFAIQLAALLDGLAVEVMLGDPSVDAARMRRLAYDFVSRILDVRDVLDVKVT